MKIVTFGEIMMRLNPEGYRRFTQADKFEVSYAGGEVNVAVSLANYGMEVSFVTKLPENPLGEAARNAVRHFGVETKDIVWGGPRLGTYFVEKGASQRASKVVYDRAGSSIALAKRTDFDWAKILRGVKWFHFTGITPALGGELPAICLDALEYCKAHKITVSGDLNYSRQAFGPGLEAKHAWRSSFRMSMSSLQTSGRGGCFWDRRQGHRCRGRKTRQGGVCLCRRAVGGAFWREESGDHAPHFAFRL